MSLAMRGKCFGTEATMRRLMCLARAILLALALLTSLILGCLHTAHARAGEALIDFGQTLKDTMALRTPGKARGLAINNVQLRLVSADTQLSLHDAMDRMYGLCDITGGVLMPETVAKQLNVKPTRKGMKMIDGVYRYETEDAGVIACIETGGRLRFDDLTARLSLFTKTRDLASIGPLRYVLFRRSSKHTTLLALWTEGPALLLDAFPRLGDAPGTDPENLQRPNGIRRLLSARELGTAYSVTLYEASHASKEWLREWYAQSLNARGWTLVDVPDRTNLVAKLGGRIVNIYFHGNARSQMTIAIAELSK
jgi:hypothetical protein